MTPGRAAPAAASARALIVSFTVAADGRGHHRRAGRHVGRTIAAMHQRLPRQAGRAGWLGASGSLGTRRQSTA